MRRRTFLASTAGLTSFNALSLSPLNAFSNQEAAAVNTQSQRLIGTPGLIHKDRLVGRNQNRSTVIARHGVVASSQPLASTVGLDILKKGGNAIDAAIAANAMLSVVEPMSCGPGGDLFAIVWIERDQTLYGLNASGRSPYRWNLEKAKSHGYDQQLPLFGPHTWSVPGCVSGWRALQTRFGSLTIRDVLEPAANYAKEGFGVTEIIAGEWSGAASTFKEHPNGLNTFTADGQAPRYGQVFSNPDIASFFEILMRDGAESFYKGEIAERLVQYSEERGGYFSIDDFHNHEATWVDPVSTSYRGYRLYEIPPNGQGIAALQMLNILEQFDIASLEPNSAEHLHLFLEAKKLVFEDRAVYYADMEKAEVPLDWLVSKEYGKQRAKQIDPDRASVAIKPGRMDGSSDTVYLCAADGEGNMISLIQSIYWGWGSKEVPSGLGFCLQNRGRSFSLDPSHRNRLEPNKRPFHTIIPGFLMKDNQPQCAFGVMGGDFQPQGHVQVMMNLIDFQMSIQQAGEQPRAEHNGSSSPFGDTLDEGGTVSLEAGIPDSVVDQLKAMGHRVDQVGTGRFGGYQAIWRETSPLRFFAGTDPRKDGCASGY